MSARKYWEDFETGRRGYTDNGVFPDGPFVEEISRFEFDGGCACGKAEMDGKRCALGATHRGSAPKIECTPDDEALS